MTVKSIIKRVWLNHETLTSEEYDFLVKENGGDDNGATAIEIALKLDGKLDAWRAAGRPSFNAFINWYHKQSNS